MPYRTKKRTTPFPKKHLLIYGLEVACSRATETGKISSVRGKFRVAFGRVGPKTEVERKRKVTDNIKYFTYHFRADNYKSHLKSHAIKWEEYKGCSRKQQKAFFDTGNEPFVNTLPAHFDTEKESLNYEFDKDVDDQLIGGMLFDLNDELDDCLTKEKALSMFIKDTNNDEEYEYFVTVSNCKQFCLAIKYIGLGCLFLQVSHMYYQVTKEELNCGYMGSLNLCKVISYARVLVAISLQVIKELLNVSWCYSVACDAATH